MVVTRGKLALTSPSSNDSPPAPQPSCATLTSCSPLQFCVMGCITDAMSAPPVDRDVVENGDEAEESQPVSQWMCDICQSQSEPRFENPAITRCFVCQAHICQEHAWYNTRELRWNPVIGRMVPLHPETAACPGCHITSASEPSSDHDSVYDDGSDSNSSAGFSLHFPDDSGQNHHHRSRSRSRRR